MDEEKNAKLINNSSFLVDVNMIEAPLFVFKPSKSTKTVQYWIDNKEVSNRAKEILERKNSKNEYVEYMRWSDSRGNDREILASSQNNLPNGFAMDVLFTLIALYIKKSPPIYYNEDKKSYDLPTRKLECSLSEVCRYMDISDAGNNIKRIRDAIDDLFMVSYHCLTDGIIYNSRNEEFHQSVKAIRLLDYELLDKNQRIKRRSQSLIVTFGDIILANIEKSFIRFLSNDTYFSLKSGITRRLYTYIEGNKHNKEFIVRRFNTLRYKMPIDFLSKSHLKRKLKAPLERLIEAGVIKDYMYADEFNIPVEDKEAIYFIFKGTKSTLIKKIEEEYNKKHPKIRSKKSKLEDKFELQFPNDVQKELLEFGINEVKVQELVRKHSKYKLAEYILWLKDGISKGKVKDPAGLFIFAITDEKVKVASSHPQITEFVEKIKSEADEKSVVSKELIDKAYKKYIEKEFTLFEEEDEFMFISMKSTVLDDIEKVKDKKIKSQRQLYNMATAPDEKDKLLKNIEKWEKFSVEREKSELFIEMFVKSVKLYRGLKDYEEFKQYYKDNNK